MRLAFPTKRFLVIVVALTASLSVTGCAELLNQGGAGSAGVSEQALVSRINGYRAARGLPGLQVHGELQNKARSWAAHMAAGGCGITGGTANICHSRLADGITVQWRLLAENVGYVSPRDNVDGMESAFENSPPHAANMANGSMNYVGVGVAYRDNLMYVTEVFMAA